MALQLPSSHPPFPSPLICPTAHHFPDLSVQVLSPSTTHTTTAILSSELHGDSPTDLQSPRFPLCSHLPPGHADPATKCQLPEYPLVMLPKTIAAVVGLKSPLGLLKPQGLDSVPKGQEAWWSLVCSPTATSKAFLEERYSTERVRGNLYCQTAEHFLSTTVIPHDPAPRSCKETLLPTVQLLPSAAEPRREQIQPHKQGTPGRTKWMQSWDVISWSPLQNHRPVLGSKVENPSQDMSFFTVLCKARD